MVEKCLSIHTCYFRAGTHPQFSESFLISSGIFTVEWKNVFATLVGDDLAMRKNLNWVALLQRS